jgi:cell division protein FtsL
MCGLAVRLCGSPKKSAKMGSVVARSETIAAVLGHSGGRASSELLWSGALALLLIVISAFAVIYTTHACRELYSSLQGLESEQWLLQEDYGRLILEQSTWSSHYRVEKVARSELGMRAPDLARLKVLSP